MDSKKHRVQRLRYVRAYRARHKLYGLCHDCSDPAEPGAARCAMHLLIHARWRTWRANHKGRIRPAGSLD